MNMTSKRSNQPKSVKCNPTLLKADTNPEKLRDSLREHSCDGCELGGQINFKAPVVYRGDPDTRRMVIGKAPGKNEDKEGLPFVGKAGKLFDEMFKEGGWDTNTDFYVTNTIKCRPVAERGSGKENLTPTTAQRAACRPYIQHEIRVINPRMVVLLGATAVKSILPELKNKKMGELVGRIHYSDEFPSQTFFIMYHPSYLLRKQHTAEYKILRPMVINHMETLKQLIEELEDE